MSILVNTAGRFFASKLRRPIPTNKMCAPLENWRNVPSNYSGRSHFGTSSDSESAAGGGVSGNIDDDSATHLVKPFDMAYSPVNPFQMNQYVIACTRTRQAAIIDCGASTSQELNAFLTWISDSHYKLSAIWQTHAHLDHIAGLGILTNTSGLDEYSNIPIYLHERDRGIYNNFENRCKDFGFQVEGNSLPPPDTQLNFFDDDTKQLSLGELRFDIIPTPGHCPGQVGFLLESQNTRIFFGGDFIMQGSIGRTDFHESNVMHMESSIQRFIATQHDDTIIYPGHGQPTTLKQEKQSNPFLTPFV